MSRATKSKRAKRTEKPERTYSPRGLARSVAKTNMRRAGFRQINKNFSLNWRSWVGNVATLPKRKRSGKATAK